MLRDSLTKEAIVAFQSCMESPAQDGESNTGSSSQKEIVVRSLLSSDWVQKFEMSLSRRKDPVSLIRGGALSILADESSFTQDLHRDSSEIEKSFQKSLNSSFEGTSMIFKSFHEENFSERHSHSVHVLFWFRIFGETTKMGGNRCSA